MSQNEREIELYDYIEVLLKYKWFVLVVTLICGASGWFLRAEPPSPTYEADVVLIIKKMPTQQTGGEEVTSTQSSGFYEALARDDGLKKAVIHSLKGLTDSLGIGMSLTAMDGMLHVQILDPGVKLTVRHSNPHLPIPLVNTWASLYVARNSDLSSEEGGRYYDYVESQFQTTRDHLETIEADLRSFENDNQIAFLQMQQSMLDTATMVVHRDLFALESALQDTLLEIQATDIRLRAFISGFHAPYHQTLFELQNQEVATSLNQFYEKFEKVLRDYDKATDFHRFVGLHGTAIIEFLEKELSTQAPALGNLPNPNYLQLSQELIDLRLQIGASNVVRGPTTTDSIGITKVRERFLILQRQRNRIEQALGLVVQKRLQSSKRIVLEERLKTAANSLANKVNIHQGLSRDRDLLRQTLDRLSQLVEGARISRAKAANDIRVLTQALEVRSTSPARSPQITAVATGVGLLISTILSLFIEYVRKARHSRSGEYS